ncbi:hypothetical protein Q31b_31620 [Novipirellula aureliae]|uniref:Uncharacterized protein n=1 Tax=Novipirellula aureliae TaxID=2527966 RepID=A0A5C6DV61_9BACT|nr:hypothetical protein [Novipirellula aureliae]TWU39847.1 hypothetical protein Q31b_31620 [Novipirellula aureliae]
MTLYLQHGHGKSDRIRDSFNDKSSQGVIFAARNEQPDKLDACIAELRTLGSYTLMLDPQFHICTVAPPKDRYLPDHYPYYEAGRNASDFIGAKKLREYAASTIQFQHTRDLDRLLSPTVILSSFSDRWSQIALQLADSSVDVHAGLTSPKPLLLSFVISESAFDSRSELEMFLDTLTSWDVHGFYLCIVRDEASYSQSFDQDRLANILYATYVLGDRNQFEVNCGYSDFVGLTMRAAGATTIATGWSQSQRQCHMNTFVKKDTIARRPRLRYSSGPLLNTIMISELEQIANIGRLNDVLSGVPLDSEITSASSPDSSAWNDRLSERHHWQTLNDIDSTLVSNVRKNLLALLTRVRYAKSLYVDLKANGIQFQRLTNDEHLDQWDEALEEFQRIASP